jgi:large subunit ribosomal protein L29
MVKATELVAMHPEELTSRLAESRREMLNLRFQLATGQLDNTARLRLVRRDVARILSVMREREIAEIEGAVAPPPVAAPTAAVADVEVDADVVDDEPEEEA